MFEDGDASTSEPHDRFFTQCTALNKNIYRVA
jgi:hypothetical protein